MADEESSSNGQGDASEYIVYIETDITVFRAQNLRDAERRAEKFAELIMEHFSQVALKANLRIDETRVVTSERVIKRPWKKVKRKVRKAEDM